MKKIFHILVFTAIFFTGCEERVEIDHPIAGHTYCFYTDTDSGYYISYIDFHPNGDFIEHYVEHDRYLGDRRGTLTHMLWSVEGNIHFGINGNLDYMGLEEDFIRLLGKNYKIDYKHNRLYSKIVDYNGNVIVNDNSNYNIYTTNQQYYLKRLFYFLL